MSDEELERRRVTGQLHTSAVREKTIRLLSTNYDKTVKMMVSEILSTHPIVC